MGIDGIEFHPRYQQKFGFFRIFFRLKKSPPTPAKSRFENTIGNPFFGTLFFGTKCSTKKFRTVIIQHFIKKLLSDLIPDLGKCPNQKTHEIRKYTYLHVFWFGHFPRSGIESGSSLLIKCYIITVLIFFFQRFGQYLKKSKNGFPIVF